MSAAEALSEEEEDGDTSMRGDDVGEDEEGSNTTPTRVGAGLLQLPLTFLPSDKHSCTIKEKRTAKTLKKHYPLPQCSLPEQEEISFQ